MSGLTRVGDGEGGDAVSSLRQEYVQAVLERADRQWPEDGTAEDKWSVVRSALVDSAEETLGRARRRQPDWFVKSEDTIRPYLQMRNAAYTRWLASNNQCDLAEFREARGRARAAVRRSKSDWFRRWQPRWRGKGLVGRKYGSVLETCSVGGEAGCQSGLSLWRMRMVGHV